MNIESTAVFVPANADELRDNWLRDIRLEALAQGLADPPIQPGTDLYIRATANANADLIQYSNIAIADQATDLLSATGEALDEKRKAYGLPEVKPSPATGKLIVGVLGGGSVTFTPATQFVTPNGKRGQIAVNTTTMDGGLVPIVTIDTGADMNLPAGTKVRFVATPLNAKTEATVYSGGFRGGLDEESDDRKRERILNELGHLRAGGNWPEKVEVSLDADASVQGAFVYPALGGPGSEKVAIMRAPDPLNFDFSRMVPAGTRAIVQAAHEAAFAAPFEEVIQSVQDQQVDVALLLALPEFASNGWVNRPVWPPLDAGDTRVRIGAYTPGALTVTIAASTSTPPIANVTQIAWWSPTVMQFYVKTITSVAGGAGAWVCGIDSPLVDGAAIPGLANDFISPAAVNMAAYGVTWTTVMGLLGPGENTTTPARLSATRGQRRPTTAEAFPCALTSHQTDALETAHTEIADVQYSYPLAGSARTPTVPVLVATAPNVFIPRHFGLYPIT